MDKVVSYSLFGTEPAYYQGVDVLVLAHHAIFKGFELRIHCHSTTRTMPQFSFLERLDAAGKLKLVFHEEKLHLTRAMMWRLLPLWDGTRYLFTRDIDAIPMVRDRAMAEEFIQTGCAVHNMVDGLGHNWRNTPLMGGCMGFNVKKFRAIIEFDGFEDFMRFSGHDDDWFNTYANDEIYLREKIWPMVCSDSCMHVTNGMPDCPAAGLNIRAINFDLVADLPPVILAGADKFADNVCAKWWKYDESRRFYREHGDPELLKIIYDQASNRL